MSSPDLRSEAHSERRLGQLICESKSGPALAAAVSHFLKAAALWKSDGGSANQAACLADAAATQERMQQFRQAAEHYQQALRLYIGLEDHSTACDCAMGAARALHAAESHQQALATILRALELADKVNDHLRLADTRMLQARILGASQQLDEALEVAKQALDCFIDYHQGTRRIACEKLIAELYQDAGNDDAAAAAYSELTERCITLGRQFEASVAISAHAEMELSRQNVGKALRLLQHCLQIQEQSGNKDLQSQTLRLIGTAHLRQGSFPEAIDAYQRSYDLASGTGQLIDQAKAAYLIGKANAAAGDSEGAIHYIGLAADHARASGDLRLQEKTLAALSKVQRRQGHNDAAKASLDAWIQVLGQLGDRQDQIRVIGDLAQLLRDEGDLEKAEAHYRHLLEICTPGQDDADICHAQHAIATLQVHRGQLAAAAESYAQAVDGYLRYFEGHKDGREYAFLADLFQQYGKTLLQLERPTEAMAQLESALEAHRHIEHPNGRARVLVSLGNAHLLLGEEGEAKAYFTEAASICEQQGDLRATSIIRKATNA